MTGVSIDQTTALALAVLGALVLLSRLAVSLYKYRCKFIMEQKRQEIDDAWQKIGQLPADSPADYPGSGPAFMGQPPLPPFQPASTVMPDRYPEEPEPVPVTEQPAPAPGVAPTAQVSPGP